MQCKALMVFSIIRHPASPSNMVGGNDNPEADEREKAILQLAAVKHECADAGAQTTLNKSGKCQRQGCEKTAQGGTDLCKAHGGGKGERCQHEGCQKRAQGSSGLCRAHFIGSFFTHLS